MLDKLKKLLIGNRIQDIKTVGFIYFEDKTLEYFPDLRWLYLEFDNSIIEFASVEQYSKLRIQFVDEIQFNYEIDEDMKICYSSIINIVLAGSDMSTGNIVNTLDVINPMNKGNVLICDALKITLVNEEILFLDPTFLHGISIGGIEQENVWIENDSLLQKAKQEAIL